MLVTTTFKEVKVGEKFFYHGFQYIKTQNFQNGKKGATNLDTGEAVTDCNIWSAVQIELDPKKKNSSPKRKIINMVITDEDRCYQPVIIRITEEQKRLVERLVEIMYDNEMLYESLNIDYLDELPIIDATEE